MDCFRDSFVSHTIRVISRRRLLQYPEERDPSRWKAYIRDNNALEKVDTVSEIWLSTLVSQTRSQQRSPGSSNASDVGDLEKSKDVTIITWADDNDQGNPQNWGLFKKFFVSGLVCLITFSIYIGSAIYTPSIPGIAAHFHVSEVAATLGLTLFVAGYGCGPMLWSPMSEVPQIGRNPVYCMTLLVFVVLQLAVVMPHNFGMLLAFRYLTGFIGSPALATGGASMCDIWTPSRRSYGLGVWGVFAISAPVLGPLVGGFAVDAKGWTWPIWELMWLSGFCCVLILFLLPETNATNILHRRARRVRKLTKNNALKSQSDVESEGLKVKDLAFESFIRPFTLCFREPIIFLLNSYVALIYGIFYAFFEAYPIVFGEIHGFNSGETGLAFLGILIGTFITVAGYFTWMHKSRDKYYDENGDIAPERQLPPACLGALALPVSLIWFGWTGNFVSVHWICPIISTMVFSVGGCLIFNCIFSYLTDAYPKYAASVLAGNDFMRSMFGAGFPLFASAMFHNLGVGWASTLLGCLTIVFVPIPFVLVRYGRRIRLASKHARHDI